MENNLENKIKFFALYWGQIVAIVSKGSYTHPKGTVHLVDKNTVSSVESENYTKHRYSLELKPLSSISAKEAIFVFNLDKGDQPKITKIYSTYGEYLHIEYEFMGSEGVFLDNGIIVSSNSLGLDAIMKLTKLGYHIGTEKEIEYGWVKLKGETK